LPGYVGIRGEGGDASPNEERRLGGVELLDLLGSVAPIGLRYPEVIEHPLRTKKAGRHRQRREISTFELLRQREGHANDGCLYQIVEEIAPVVVAVAIGDLENDATWS